MPLLPSPYSQMLSKIKCCPVCGKFLILDDVIQSKLCPDGHGRFEWVLNAPYRWGLQFIMPEEELRDHRSWR